MYIFKKNFKLIFDRSFSSGLGKQIIWLLAIMVVVYVFLIFLSHIKMFYLPGKGDSQGRWYDIFFLLMDPGSSSGAMSSPFVILCSLLGLVVFSGMLISVISNVLERRVESYEKGETDYDVRNHVVILGLNQTVPSLLRVIHDNYPDSYILLMCNGNSGDVRDWIHANVSPQIETKLIVMNGDRNTMDDLQRLKCCNHVKEIYILGEQEEEDHDAKSMDCLKKLSHLITGEKIKCHVLLESQTMFGILQSVDIDEQIKERIDFLPFNFNEIWTQEALATIPSDSIYINGEKQPWTFKSLDGDGITRNSEKHVHLVIFGMTEMGKTLAVNAAHILHFPNYKEGQFETCSKITFIDSEAQIKGKVFRGYYKNLFDLARWRFVDKKECLDSSFNWRDPMTDEDSLSPYKGILGDVNFMDIQWEFITGEVYDEEIKTYLDICSQDKNTILDIAFCGDNSERNTESCMSLPDIVIQRANQILVRQKGSPLMENMLMKRAGFENIRPFGIMSECFYGHLKHEEYGKLVNASYDSNINIYNKSDVQNAWDQLKIAHKWSSVYCANMLYYKLRLIGLNTTEVITKEDIASALSRYEDDMQRTEHNRWNTEKLLLGFRPLASEEEREKWKNDKKEMKDQLLHLDILSNDMLKHLDPGVIDYDINVNKKLADIYVISKSPCSS